MQNALKIGKLPLKYLIAPQSIQTKAISDLQKDFISM